MVVGGASGAGGWGTWEELILGSAVVRHGGAAWATVAKEVCSRSPCVFSPEDCEAKFAEIQSRYSPCNAWIEELRKERIAELKRELDESEKSIGILQSQIENLSISKHGDGSSDCRATHTESCSLSGNVADNNSSSKELSRDRSSAASFTEEASHCQKSQQVQKCHTDSIQRNTISTEVCVKDSLFWGSRKQRGGRGRRIFPKADVNSRDSEPTSTSCIDRDGSSECFKEDVKKGLNLKASNVESGAVKKDLKTSNVEPDAVKKGLKTPNVEPGVIKKGLTSSSIESGVMKRGLEVLKLESGVMENGMKTPKLESDVMKNSLKTTKGESGVSVIEGEKTNLAGILKSISSQVDSLMLQRQIDIQRKRVAYKKMIRRHMDFQILHSNISSGVITSTKELLRDILLFVNNVMVFYPKATLEHMAAVQLRDLACKTVNESANCVSKAASAPMAKKNAQAMEPGRHAAGDVKGNKVSSRDATVSSRQGEGKDSPNDKPSAANIKTVQKSEPAKKRGVGRPPKSAPLKGKPNAPAQEDGNSPRRGRKRRLRRSS